VADKVKSVVKGVRDLPVCRECGLRHWSAKAEVCAACRYFELTQYERTQLAPIVEFLRSTAMCAYCGEYATDVEHVVPRSSKLPTYTVPACSECNGFASGHLFPSFEAKAAYIQSKIRKRYQKLIRTPEWDESEIAELGYAMRQEVLAYSRARDWIRRRLDWTLTTALVLLEQAGGG
jgi:ribosomal protein L40E